MTTPQLKNRPRVAAALQLALLLGVFQGVVATTPSLPGTPAVRIESATARPLTAIASPVPLSQAAR